MVHDPSSRAAARHLLVESDVVPSDELTDALAQFSELGRQSAPPMSSAVREALQQAALTAIVEPTNDEIPSGDAAADVVSLRYGKARRRGAAVGGAVVLAMAAGMGGVAAFGPDNALNTAIHSVIGWAVPPEQIEQVSDDEIAPAQTDPLPAGVPGPEVPPAAGLPDTAPSHNAEPPYGSGGVSAPDTEPGPAEPADPAPTPPASPRPKPADAGEGARGKIPSVDLPELPVPLPEPVTTPRAVIPVEPPQLPVPGGPLTSVPGPTPSR